MSKEKVLLDTDIGTEVDDAISLALLLADPGVDLIGITTVTGEAMKRAQMASAICKAAGKEVPIFCGSEAPLRGEQIEKYAPQAVVLDRWEHDSDFLPNQAIPFMQKVIRENPGEINLIAIAPFTNIGLLFSLDPELPALLKSLSVMCGSPTYTRYDGQSEKMSAMDATDKMVLASKGILENNAMIDPVATSIMYKARIKDFYSYGLNVTSRLTMPVEEAEKLFSSPALGPVLDIAKVWFEDEKRITFHDPLTVVALFHPDVCEYETGDIIVDTTEGLLSGFTYFKKNPEGNCKVAMAVDKDKFFNYALSVLRGEVK